jgi:S1-C subfamily serine protease
MAANLEYKPLRMSKLQPNFGDSVAVIGFPLDTDLVILLGSVLLPNDSRGQLQIATPAAPGQSGSPVLNKNGEVLGILVGGYADRPGVVFATPLTSARALLASTDAAPNSGAAPN